jgi:hypothetical protein
MQKLVAAQLTPLRESSSALDVSGEVTIPQPAPSHRSISVWVTPDAPKSVPTATQKLALTQLTPVRMSPSVLEMSGELIIVQLLPSHSSMSVCPL